MKNRILLAVALLLLALPVHADHSININTADKATLETLTGIGPSKAQAIIDYRTQNGPFASIEEINNVSGIGDATYNNIKDHITVSGGISTAPTDPTTQPPTSGQTSPQSSSQIASASATNEFGIEAGNDRTTVAGGDVQLAARAWSGKAPLENVAFSWNFGDGTTGQGASVTHRFQYPGRYVVVVSSSHDGDVATDRFVVTVEAADLAVRTLPDGGVEIENRGRDVDLSRWSLQSGGQRFTFPENSLVLAGQTMRISPEALHFYAGSATALHYPSGEIAFRAGETAVLSPSPSEPLAPREESASARVANAEETQAPEAIFDAPETIQELEKNDAASNSSQVAAAAQSDSGSLWWWLAAGGLTTASAAAVLVTRRFRKGEWEIIDDSESSV